MWAEMLHCDITGHFVLTKNEKVQASILIGWFDWL